MLNETYLQFVKWKCHNAEGFVYWCFKITKKPNTDTVFWLQKSQRMWKVIQKFCTVQVFALAELLVSCFEVNTRIFWDRMPCPLKKINVEIVSLHCNHEQFERLSFKLNRKPFSTDFTRYRPMELLTLSGDIKKCVALLTLEVWL